jgi:UDP-N-acetylmuramoylalanine--D-glutamate ligase
MKTLVVGLEKSGLASVEFLVKRGDSVTATDRRALDELPVAADLLRNLGVPFVSQADAEFTSLFTSVDLVVTSPGVPNDMAPLLAAREAGVTVIGEVELAAPYLKGNTIGITGSNGKTTTTALIGHILEQAGVPAQVGGNIGTPVIAMTTTSREGQWNVLELSSFQLETVRTFHTHVGVALNVTQNHLDRHHTFESYAAAKGNLFRPQTTTDFAVLNQDDAVCRSFAGITPAQVVWFSNTVIETLMPAADVPIRGRHNAENVMAAASVARIAGVPDATIADAVRTFQAVEHRLEFVRNVNGVDYYNDSKATSVDAALKAIEGFAGNLWVILGGKDKGSDYTMLRDSLQAKARAALLIGAARLVIESQLTGFVPLIDSGTLESAVHEASRKAGPGDTVLLAPACASFDQFKSYEHRGAVFKQLVRDL